jgi:hypothetical protein
MVLSVLRNLIFFFLLAAGLLAPGWLLGRVLRVPAGLVSAFLGSGVVLFHVALALAVFDLPLDLSHLAGGLAAVSLVLWLVERQHAQTMRPAPGASMPRTPWSRQHWLLLPATLGLASIALKAGLEPLSGVDNGFRWDQLARQMLLTEGMDFYPPVTDRDFLLYFWCDGIAPLISDLYLWCYLSLGQVIRGATTPVVIGQGLLLFRVVYQLAARHAGPVAGRAATALLASSALLLWSVAMGQETGLTALSLVSMLLFLDHYRTDPHAGWLIWAGLAAGAGALSREYGLAFVPLGWFALQHGGRFRRGAVTFTLTAAAIALPWFMRNWIRTGNPLFSHELGGLFPVNPAHRAYMHCIAELTRYWESPRQLGEMAVALGALALLPLGLGLASGMNRWRDFAPWTLAMLVMIGLWLWSIRQTAGGMVYSLRVLTPALSVGAALGGIALGRLSSARNVRWLFLLLAIPLSVDASVRALYMPFDHMVAWWRNSPGAWRDFGAHLRQEPSPVWSAIVQAADTNWILVLDPGHCALLAKLGAQAVPPWSPKALFLGDPKRDFAQSLTLLRAQGARFVILPRNDVVSDRFVSRSRFLRELTASTQPALIDPSFVLYDLCASTLDSRITPGLLRSPTHAH